MKYKPVRHYAIKIGDVLKKKSDGLYYTVLAINSKHNRNNYIFKGLAVYGNENLFKFFETSEDDDKFIKVFSLGQDVNIVNALTMGLKPVEGHLLIRRRI